MMGDSGSNDPARYGIPGQKDWGMHVWIKMRIRTEWGWGGEGEIAGEKRRSGGEGSDAGDRRARLLWLRSDLSSRSQWLAALAASLARDRHGLSDQLILWTARSFRYSSSG